MESPVELRRSWDRDGPSWTLRGNGGMIGTAMDLYRVFQALEDGKTLPPAALNHLHDRYHRDSRTGQKMMFVAGGNTVFNAVYVLAPAKHFSFIGMSNDGEETVEKSAQAIVRWVGTAGKL